MLIDSVLFVDGKISGFRQAYLAGTKKGGILAGVALLVAVKYAVGGDCQPLSLTACYIPENSGIALVR